jgi:hypothetical protein
MMPLQQLMKHDAVKKPAKTESEKDTRGDREARWTIVLHGCTRAPLGHRFENKSSLMRPFLWSRRSLRANNMR